MLLREKVGVDTENSIVAVYVSMHFETHIYYTVWPVLNLLMLNSS